MFRTRLTRTAVLAALGAGAVVASVVATAAAEEPVAAEGVPAAAEDVHAPAGYYVWHEEGGFHLRTHGPNVRHHFTAVLRTDGEFVDVRPARLEPGDVVRVLDGGHTLYIDVLSFDGIDGVDFRVRGADGIRLRLELNGHLIPTDRIFLGAANRHPDANPFSIRF